MTNLEIKDGAANNKFLSTSGEGTDEDPYVLKKVIHGTQANAVTAAVLVDSSGHLQVDALTVANSNVAVTTMPASTNVVVTTLPASMNTVVTTMPASINVVGLAGTALLGKVGIDQATTNANQVVVKSITTGDTNIGNVDVVTLPALAAGTNLIGKVSIDQATANANEIVIKSITAGNNNIGNVDIATLPVLTAGTNLIGKVSIDQVTENANEVVVKSITAGTNILGKVSIDQATANANEVVIKSITAGDNNIGNVDIASVAAGTNLIGKFGIDQATSNANEIVVKSFLGSLPDTAATDLAHIHVTNDTLAAGVVGGHYQVDIIGGTVTGSFNSATTITPYNIALTVADTQYSQALPTNTYGIEFRARNGKDIRYAFVTGKVAGPTAEYFTLSGTACYSKDNIDLSSKTIYFACATTGEVVELMAWSV